VAPSTGTNLVSRQFHATRRPRRADDRARSISSAAPSMEHPMSRHTSNARAHPDRASRPCITTSTSSRRNAGASNRDRASPPAPARGGTRVPRTVTDVGHRIVVVLTVVVEPKGRIHDVVCSHRRISPRRLPRRPRPARRSSPWRPRTDVSWCAGWRTLAAATRERCVEKIVDR
jgi:hypothetical protein